MRGIKILCTALAVLLVCTNLSAKEGINWGIKGGINSSQFHSMVPTDFNQARLDGFQVGLFVNSFKLSSYLQIFPELIYIRKGNKKSVIEKGTVVKTELDYLELPVLLKVNLIPNKKVNPYLIGGPYVSYRVRAKDIYYTFEIKKYDFKYRIKTLDFGIIGGAGVELKLGGTPDCILLEARYECGLINLDKMFYAKEKNSGFVFSIGMGF